MSWKLLVLMVGLQLAMVAAEKPVQFNEESDGKTVALEVGDCFDITLAENPSTGFSWEIVAGLDGVIEQVGEREFSPSRQDKHLVGAGGTVTYHLKAVGTGTVTLNLAYRRPWEKETPPAKSYQLTVTVSQ